MRSVWRVLSELLLTAAGLLFLLAFYLLVWTNVQTDAAQRSLLADFRADVDDSPGAAPAANEAPDVGDGMSVLHIPRLGADWEWVVVEGVDTSHLNDGPGHFPDTALPGEIGNFAVAGHRATHGAPFAELDKVEVGDKVYVEAIDGWFTYQVTWSRIVPPSAVEVIAPVAGQPGAVPRERTLTLVTCNPRWSSTERMVVGASLIEVRDPAAGPPPALDR